MKNTPWEDLNVWSIDLVPSVRQTSVVIIHRWPICGSHQFHLCSEAFLCVRNDGETFKTRASGDQVFPLKLLGSWRRSHSRSHGCLPCGSTCKPHPRSFSFAKPQLISMTCVNHSLNDSHWWPKQTSMRRQTFCKYYLPIAAAVRILPGAFQSKVMGSRFKYPFKQLR